MPSSGDIAHDGGLCTFTIFNNSWKFHQLASVHGNRYGTEKTGGMASHYVQNLHFPGQSPPASQAGRRVGPAL
jgi:hypothetical protein